MLRCLCCPTVWSGVQWLLYVCQALGGTTDHETVCDHFIARFVLPETRQMQHAGWTDRQLAACVGQHNLVAILEFLIPTWGMSALSSCRVAAA